MGYKVNSVFSSSISHNADDILILIFTLPALLKPPPIYIYIYTGLVGLVGLTGRFYSSDIYTLLLLLKPIKYTGLLGLLWLY